MIDFTFKKIMEIEGNLCPLLFALIAKGISLTLMTTIYAYGLYLMDMQKSKYTSNFF